MSETVYHSQVQLPRLYAILDAGCFADPIRMLSAAEDLAAGGITLLQYRNKSGQSRQMLRDAQELKRLLGERVRLIINDRADLCVAADFDGLHVGQEDLPPDCARRIIGTSESGEARWLGVSTHNPEQLADADQTSADYLAIGPVFKTSSKLNPDPVVGLEGVLRARQLTRRPLVAIGGINRVNARSVVEAGADSVAVISDLIREPRKSAEEFLRILG